MKSCILTAAPVLVALFTGCAASSTQHPRPTPQPQPEFARLRIESAPNTPRPPFHFSREDEALLDEVQRGAFNYLWSAGDPSKPGRATGMVPDRTSKPTVSVAGVGFQLSGLCIGVERGWITREQGRERAILILRALHANPDNRKAGLFYHFIHPDHAGQPEEAYEHVVSTIDSALLFAGILTASQYFGGEVQTLGDQLFAQADWAFFISGPTQSDPTVEGFVSLGWKPLVKSDPTGDGTLLPYAWIDSGDEHKLIAFLGACAPSPANRLSPAHYYTLRRQLGTHNGDLIAWFPWSGAHFTNFFAHCWINYAALGLDDPTALNIWNRPRVDWWENSRRMTRMHRAKAIANPKNLPTLSATAWGLTASDIPTGYGVPGLFPDPAPMPGAVIDRDFARVRNPVKDDYGDGTIAPYGAGCSIMFEPTLSLEALRYYRNLDVPGASLPLWSDPAQGGYGFQDAFNLGKNWVAPDCLAIDQGPLLLAIENARTGLIWEHFSAHPFVRAGMQRLKMDTRRPAR